MIGELIKLYFLLFSTKVRYYLSADGSSKET